MSNLSSSNMNRIFTLLGIDRRIEKCSAIIGDELELVINKLEAQMNVNTITDTELEHLIKWQEIRRDEYRVIVLKKELEFRQHNQKREGHEEFR